MDSDNESVNSNGEVHLKEHDFCRRNAHVWTHFTRTPTGLVCNPCMNLTILFSSGAEFIVLKHSKHIFGICSCFVASKIWFMVSGKTFTDVRHCLGTSTFVCAAGRKCG